jgi:hypothetical protein
MAAPQRRLTAASALNQHVENLAPHGRTKPVPRGGVARIGATCVDTWVLRRARLGRDPKHCYACCGSRYEARARTFQPHRPGEGDELKTIEFMSGLRLAQQDKAKLEAMAYPATRKAKPRTSSVAVVWR